MRSFASAVAVVAALLAALECDAAASLRHEDLHLSELQNLDEHHHHDDDGCEITLEREEGGLAAVHVGGTLWFRPGDACVNHQERRFCARDGSLKLSREMKFEPRGRDAIGGFSEMAWEYVLGDTGARTHFVLREYDDKHTVIFKQHFRDALNGTQFAPEDKDMRFDQRGRHGTASWYPSFRIEDPVEGAAARVAVRLSGPMLGGDWSSVEPWTKDGLRWRDALASGPLAVGDGRCAAVISSASHFMSSSNAVSDDKQELGFGVMGSVTEIPQHHSVSTIVSTRSAQGRPDGIRGAYKTWGAKLRALYGTQRMSDPTFQYLQYSTDNGAYYYYKTEPNKDYQETIEDVLGTAAKRGIPFKSWLMDSWWYFKSDTGKGGLKNWTARPDVFPDGIEHVRDATGLMIMAHNRWFAVDTDYAKQNGGDFEFVIEDGFALPLEQRFWDTLLRAARRWGLTVYEQDWLYNQFEHFKYTLESVRNARTWLLQMGAAAEAQGIPIQYCMSWPRHALQSLEINAVTQARASDDYMPGKDQWRQLGVSNMFAEALQLRPSKDNFYSNSTTQVNGRYPNKSEPASALHAIISTLSTGPVAPSDRVDALNKSMIMRSCAANGRLLHPDAPAVRTDRSLLAEAATLEFKKHEVVVTHSQLSGFRYTYVVAERAPAFELGDADIYESGATDHVVWRVDGLQQGVHLEKELPIEVPETTAEDFRAYAVAPVLGNGWALLGEASTKWVPVSSHRFSNLVVLSDPKLGFKVSVRGAPGEKVEVVARDAEGELRHGKCELDEAGSGVFTTMSMRCTRR